MTEIEIAKIKTDGGTQTRIGLNLETVNEYAEAMREGNSFPAIAVFHDGESYWLADGFHRVEAARQTGAAAIEAEVWQGTRRDAVLHSVGANATHGLRRTNSDKRRAAETLLRDDEWRQWSDREISRRCGVSDKTVAAVRDSLSAEIPQIKERTVKRGESTYQQNTARISTKPSNIETFSKGDTVQAKSGQTGTVQDTSGRYIKVDTANGQHTYTRENLAIISPQQPETTADSNTVQFITPEGIMSLSIEPGETWIDRYHKVKRRYGSERYLFANITEGAIFLDDDARSVFNLLYKYKDQLEWGNNTVSGVRFWVLLKRDQKLRHIPLLRELWAKSVKGIEYKELLFNQDDLRPRSQINAVQDTHAEKREFEILLAEVNLLMNNALEVIKDYQTVYSDSEMETIDELTFSITTVRDGLLQMMGIPVSEAV